MKKIIVLFFLLVAGTISANAGKIVTDSIRSNTLGAEVKYNVYLPDSFFKDSLKTFPVVYLLHGLSDNYDAWNTKGSMRLVADDAINSGEAVEMVIVMPNAGDYDTHNVWNGYFNMPGWNYEDFFFGEFVPEVEGKYRCISDKEHRAVMGLSMGGGGSVVYCQRHPEMFSSCYAMSAWLDNDEDQVGVKNTKIDKLYYVCKAVREHSAIDFVKNADEAVKENLRSIKWFVDCGDDDFIFDLSVDFYQTMRDAGVKSEFRVRNGVHNWDYWRTSLRQALPFASRNFGK